MIPEIAALIENFEGQKWSGNQELQTKLMEIFRRENFFQGEGQNDPAFSARERITRAPKALGFVLLNPVIKLSPAGKMLLSSRRIDEVFLRQLMKFQYPSPYHKPSAKAAKFWIKPYLEILRLVRVMGTLKFDELQIFGMQMTDYREFDEIVNKIELFRVAKAQNKGSYRKFKSEYLHKELRELYWKRIQSGDIKTRESSDKSLAKFLETQSSNVRDYADACFRYLRITGLVAVSHIGKSLSIVPERMADVDYILKTVGRDPIFVEQKDEYIGYLTNASLPKLLTDNRDMLISKLHEEFPMLKFDETLPVESLKDLLFDNLEKRKTETIVGQINEIKDYRQYDDIQKTFEQIENKELYDAPLMLEWNTWRAMTMLDGGDIKANLSFDDYGKPLSTAAGNMADIVCDYGDYNVCVEVTMASGQKQYEMEGEPVMRHLGKMKMATGKPCYCLFVAPTINDACVSQFYLNHHLKLKNYGGTLTIIPLPLQVFRKMLEDSYKASYIPNPTQVQNFFEASNEIAKRVDSDMDWYKGITDKALHWLD